LTREWLEADGLGGFACGTASGIRTRRYHSLLLTATTPPTGRLVLVNGLDAWLETAGKAYQLSSQCYSPGVLGGEGCRCIEAFDWEPWPRWIFRFEDGTRIEQELFVPKGNPVTCIRWKVLGQRSDLTLKVRPFLSGRDYHSLHRSNSGLCFDAKKRDGCVSWAPYPGVPAITAITNGLYSHEPLWYYNFRYEEEYARGLDCEEDLAAPGIFTWSLGLEDATLVLTTEEHANLGFTAPINPVALFARLRDSERKRRASFPSRLESAADAYIVERRSARSDVRVAAADESGRCNSSTGRTIIAGYPWFTDWGRDTFIALRGLCLATGRLADAREILLAWTSAVSLGMLPNRFPDRGEQPEYNAVDASLWFVVAAYEYLQAARASINSADLTSTVQRDEVLLRATIEAILEGYSRGTRYGIQLDSDGLLAAGERGVQLTWMDARVGDWIVTQRAGKPVEVQALWLNALRIAGEFSPGWEEVYLRGLASFRARFWNETKGCLYDVVDVNHRPGESDPTFRPNQILAIGGLPYGLLEADQAQRVVAAVEARLWVPLGLRSLAPDEPRFGPHYQGGVAERDGSYHQGTVWPWLLGPFVEAWVRVRGGTNAAKREARSKFLAPLLAHLDEAGLGHVSEIADAQAPHIPRGCPFQAWSVGEALRLDRVVLAESAEAVEPKRSVARRRRALVSV
ncbi:MAG TPA: amylo-alpha-1,6-glucosidase, partial [Verrucomicrobiae bacterium]|nr:amylo-alpha-1,6-glucosidase [Verrucomicrobiae bacterium]